ncbi:MAG: SpoIIIAH-like family protein, partial [Clostridia bacterium]|nr:SpoIIIAH-like family protein [Clostridia bacterium]
EAIKNAKGNTEAIAKASDKAASIAARETAEQNIEALLKAKGFKKALAIIGDNDINVVVKADSLTAQQTLQIQDIAASQSGYTADKIKILTVK